jgi:hypothetical protein
MNDVSKPSYKGSITIRLGNLEITYDEYHSYVIMIYTFLHAVVLMDDSSL